MYNSCQNDHPRPQYTPCSLFNQAYIVRIASLGLSVLSGLESKMRLSSAAYIISFACMVALHVLSQMKVLVG
jgi:hypothetical protein